MESKLDSKTLATAKHGGCVQLGDAPRVTMSEDDFANLVEGEAGEHGEMLEDGGPYNGWCFSCEELIEFSRSIINAWGIERRSQEAPLPAKRSREEDRKRWPHRGFNAYLDQAITENGEFTTWDQLTDTGDAYYGYMAGLHDGETNEFAAAQPSPGGQGDALVTDAMVMAALQAVPRETLAGVGDCDSKVIGVLTAYGIDGAVDIPTMVRAMLEAALAARQPVGEPVGAAKPGKRIGVLEAACGPERHFDPAAADAELASIPLVPLWKLPELHPRKVVHECLTTMENVRQGTKPHTSRRHVLNESISLAKRFIEQMEANERGGK